jgi:acetyl esterase/lipase
MKNPSEAVHPQLQPIVKMSPKLDFSRRNLWLIYLMMRLMPSPKTIRGILAQNHFTLSQDGLTRIRLRVYRSQTTAAPTPALLWMHGGGYILGKPEQDDERCARFVRALGITVISVDYRLAPRHPFPAGLEDCYAALQWAASHSQELNIDPQRIAVGGGSAGGGLSAALSQLAHDRGAFRPAFQLLVYPMLDDRTVLRADIDDGSAILWSQKSNQFGWESYLGQKGGGQGVPEYAAPARRADLAGLPPAWIGVGSLDLFLDEDVTYAQRLMDCGIECELQVIPGAFHGFDAINPRLPIVQDFHQSQIAALQKYLIN